MYWIYLLWERDTFLAAVNTPMDLQIPKNAGNNQLIKSTLLQGVSIQNSQAVYTTEGREFVS